MEIIENESNKVVIRSGATTSYYSYKTLVAVVDRSGNLFTTDRFYSKTTSKHLNQWFGKGFESEKVPHSVLKAKAVIIQLMKYSYYKNLVLSKTTATNIHDITGKLAAIERERGRCRENNPDDYELIQYGKDCISYIGKES